MDVTSRNVRVSPVLARLDESRELVERHTPAGLIVDRREGGRQVANIGGLELHYFDHLLIAHELDKVAVVRVNRPTPPGGKVRLPFD